MIDWLIFLLETQEARCAWLQGIPLLVARAFLKESHVSGLNISPLSLALIWPSPEERLAFLSGPKRCKLIVSRSLEIRLKEKRNMAIQARASSNFYQKIQKFKCASFWSTDLELFFIRKWRPEKEKTQEKTHFSKDKNKEEDEAEKGHT